MTCGPSRALQRTAVGTVRSTVHELQPTLRSTVTVRAVAEPQGPGAGESMEKSASEIISEKNQADTPQQKVGSVVTAIAGCALGTFALGAALGAPWPAAIASCGLSGMGVGVAYFMLRRA